MALDEKVEKFALEIGELAEKQKISIGDVLVACEVVILSIFDRVKSADRHSILLEFIGNLISNFQMPEEDTNQKIKE